MFTWPCGEDSAKINKSSFSMISINYLLFWKSMQLFTCIVIQLWFLKPSNLINNTRWTPFCSKVPLNSEDRHTSSLVQCSFDLSTEKNIPICWALLPTYCIILFLKSFEPPPIRGWTAVHGQRPVFLCRRMPANLAVESGWLPDFSGFLTASPLRLSPAPPCWTRFLPGSLAYLSYSTSALSASLSFLPVESAEQHDLNAVSTNKITNISSALGKWGYLLGLKTITLWT